MSVVTENFVQLHAVVYVVEEFREDKEFLELIEALEQAGILEQGVIKLDTSKSKKGENFVSQMKRYANPAHCLWVTGRADIIRIAKKNHIAVLGYQRHGQESFLPVEYVVQDIKSADIDYLQRVFWRFHNIPWKILETKRCIVREFSMEDLDDLFLLYAKPGMTDYVESLYGYEEEAEYERAYIRYRYRYYGYGMWLVFEKERGQLIGRAGLEDRQYKEGMELELGYMIAPEYQGQGYATEVCNAILDYAREELEYDSVNCLVDADNIASVCFMEKLGFTYIGQTDITGVILNQYKYCFFA